MGRIRKVVGKELRECPTCGRQTSFVLYESWVETPTSWWSRKPAEREDLHHSALCGECGFRLRSVTPV